MPGGPITQIGPGKATPGRILNHSRAHSVLQFPVRHEIKWYSNVLFAGALLTPWPVKLKLDQGIAVHERNLKGKKS